jgi:hypothetical protein
MNSYATQVQIVSDRWAIVAYIRALQISQNPNAQPLPMTNSNTNTTAPRTVATPPAAPANQGGAR